MLLQLFRYWMEKQPKKGVFMKLSAGIGAAAILLMIFNNPLYAQQQTITGTVTDGNTQEPLPGVNIAVQGTTAGTATGADGQYELEVPAGADSLTFSFIGFESQVIPIQGRSTIDVTLIPQTYEGDELVVVGYGEQSRETISSSISRVKMEDIEEVPFMNPAKSLQGKVAGATVRVTNGMPGAGPDVIIRGGTSTSPGNDAPLYVIDGVVTPSGLSDINSQDIKSIQVLKDAASTAIYGARGSNGIVLVETKTGGEAGGQGVFSVGYSTQIEDQVRKFPFTSAEEYIRISRMAVSRNIDSETANLRLTGGGYPYSTGNINNSDRGGGFENSRHTVEFTDDLIAANGQEYVDNLLMNKGYQTMTDPVTDRELIFRDNNYQDVMLQTGISHDLDISFSNGNENSSLYTSLGYSNQEGTVRGTYYDRLNFLTRADYKVKNNLSVNAKVDYKYIAYQDPSEYWGTLNRSSRLPHTVKMYYDDGTPAIGEGGGSPRNILHELYYEESNTNRHRMTFSVNSDWEILDGLSFEPSAALIMNKWSSRFFERAHEWNPNRPMWHDEEFSRDFIIDGLLRYTQDFNKHSVDVVAGMNFTQKFDENLEGDGSHAPTDYIPSLNASATEFERVTSFIGDDRLLSYFGRFNYNYDRTYLFSISGRVDGSSRFSKNNQWAFFPAVSAGWNIHNEDFWNIDWLSTFKLRGSWGEAGNNVLSITDTQGEYGTGYNYGFEPGILNTTLANLALRWETTRSVNIGANWGFWNNRLNVTLDVYDKLTRDRLLNIPIPKQSGFNSIRTNYGSVRNRGLEIAVDADAISKQDFNWNIGFNFSFNRLAVVDLPENGREKNRINGGLIYDTESGEYRMVGGLAEDERIGGIWAYKMTGVYATDEEAANAPYDEKVSGSWLNADQQKTAGDAIWADKDQNGIINDRDLYFMGYEAPDKVGGMVNTVNWKNFNLRFAVSYELGHVISNGWRARANGNARNRVMTITDVLSDEMWWEPGDDASIPRYSGISDADFGKRNHVRGVSYTGVGPDEGYTYANSLYFQNGDYLAFRELSLTYSLPVDIVSRLSARSISLNAGIYNLGYITPYDGISPEHYNGGERGSYFRPRQIKFKIQMAF